MSDFARFCIVFIPAILNVGLLLYINKNTYSQYYHSSIGIIIAAFLTSLLPFINLIVFLVIIAYATDAECHGFNWLRKIPFEKD